MLVKQHLRVLDFSAVTSGIKEIKEVMEEAENNRKMGEKTVLFIDEIHRFNKAQQDAFLPYVEKGSIILIGATTENPSFQVNSALLSRSKVFVLNALDINDLIKVLKQALNSEKGYKDVKISISEDDLSKIAVFANGDARTALNTLELCVKSAKVKKDKLVIDEDVLKECITNKALLYDKNGEEHYNLISALHKSMRNSDPDAAIYWLARMCESGEDPLYIARRLIRFATEDIGLADPNALLIAQSSYDASHSIGLPECALALAEAVTYLSLAPKSNSLEVAYIKASNDAKEMLAEPVPLHIRNAPTKLMQDLDYGKGYIYAHDTKEKVAKMSCLPESLKNKKYLDLNDSGKEKQYKEKLENLRKFRGE